MADNGLSRPSSKPEISFGNGSLKDSMKSIKSKPSGLSVMIEEQSSEDVDESEVKQKPSDNKGGASELKKMSETTINTDRGGNARGSQMEDFQTIIHLAVKPHKKKDPISKSILQKRFS